MKNVKSELHGIASSFVDSLKMVEDEYKKANEKQGILNRLIVDIEHEIELDKLSACNMMKKYKELQSALKLRRMYKDNIDYFIMFRERFNYNNVIATHKGLDKISNSKEKRRYTHRVKLEAREELLSEINELMEDK